MIVRRIKTILFALGVAILYLLDSIYCFAEKSALVKGYGLVKHRELPFSEHLLYTLCSSAICLSVMLLIYGIIHFLFDVTTPLDKKE
jgi:hypothetical protein